MSEVGTVETAETFAGGQAFMEHLHQRKLALLEAGEPIIDLSMINPDIPPARLLIDKLLEASAKPEYSRYAVARGIRRLREAFADKYRSEFEVSLDPESDVCVTAGTKDALLSVLRPFAGKRILLPAPTYPMHRVVAELAGMSIGYYPISGSWSETLQSIDRQISQGSIGVVLLNYPNNPTGTIRNQSELADLVQLVHRSDAWLVNDFVYGEMLHAPGGNAVSIIRAAGAQRHRVVETYSLSKAYSVPGWRVAAVVGPPDFIGSVSRFKSRADYGIFLPIQVAAAAALNGAPEITQPARLIYADRAQRFSKVLRQLGFSLSDSRAGASIWCQIPARLGHTDQFVEKLLERHHVSVIPGSYFGAEFSRWLRVALVVDDSRWGRVIRAFSESVEARA